MCMIQFSAETMRYDRFEPHEKEAKFSDSKNNIQVLTR